MRMLPQGAVVTSTKNDRVRLDRNPSLVPLRRGFQLDVSRIPPGLESWKVARLVTEARAEAALVAHPKSHGLTGEAALVNLRQATWSSAPDIELLVGGHKQKTVKLPAVKIGKILVPPVLEKRLTQRIAVCESLPREGAGTAARGGNLTKLGRAAVQIAHHAHPLVGLMAVGAAFDEPCREFEPLRHVPAPLLKLPREEASAVAAIEARVRGELREVVSGETRVRGARRARWIIDAARAGCDTVGETFLLWLLHCALPEPVYGTLWTQFPVAAGRSFYRLDLALPNERVGFEFDGGQKLTTDAEAGRRFLNRHRFLEKSGWSLVRLSSALMGRPQQALAQLVADLRELDVPLRRGPGPLWVPFPPEMLDPARRFGHLRGG